MRSDFNLYTLSGVLTAELRFFPVQAARLFTMLGTGLWRVRRKAKMLVQTVALQQEGGLLLQQPADWLVMRKLFRASESSIAASRSLAESSTAYCITRVRSSH
jgi:hypothetical protein